MFVCACMCTCVCVGTPLHYFVREERFRDPLGSQLLDGLADCQGVRLREEVGHQLVVVGHHLWGLREKGLRVNIPQSMLDS